MNKYNVVLIDDDELTIAYLSKVLDSFDNLNLVATFSSALEAHDYLQNSKIDLIFTDVELPGMSGVEYVSCMKHDTQFILISNHKFYKSRQFESPSVLGFIEKPITKHKIEDFLSEKDYLRKTG